MFKKTLVPKTEMTVGEFDITVDGAYRNVKTLPLEVRAGKKLFISITSDVPLDMALSDSDGKCIWFKDQVKGETIGPISLSRKETLALLMGVFRGDLAKVTVEVWMD